MEVKIETSLDKCPGIVLGLPSWLKAVADEVSLGASPRQDLKEYVARQRKCIEAWWSGDPKEQVPPGGDTFHYDAAVALEEYFRVFKGFPAISFTATTCEDSGVEAATDYAYDKLPDTGMKAMLTSLWSVYLCNLEAWRGLVILFLSRKMYIVSSHDLATAKTWAPRLFRFVRIMDRREYESSPDKWMDWTEIGRRP